ncbi:glycosyltransferase [Spartinivicinus poritis]|uniref:Glycosyltransferase n=1 Tax=Spartinivicinus poritis TaxID=2994640 RepID=A0ABT5UFP7_9GAMM|nr:glycosyltransferase [Spartinivicinus sp. A2-2]MDE1465173.1 glycosyltransferase [Spartinivicinus sp. A2-2]
MNKEIQLLNSTGERFVTELEGIINLEHWHRYFYVLKHCENKTVLDIASGEGYGSYLVSKVAKKIFGVDIDKDSISHAKNKYQNKNLEFIEGDCTRIPLPSCCVDVVVSFETIEHHDQHLDMMRELKRVLKPDGILIISSPDKAECSDRNGNSNIYHIKELYKDEFKNLVKNFFKYQVCFEQRVTVGSIILPEDKVTNFVNINLENKEDIKLNGLYRPIFSIIIASDTQVKANEGSLYDYPIERAFEFFKNDESFSEAVSYIAHLENDINTLNKQLIKSNNRLAILLSSNSFKITKPLRKIRSIISNYPRYLVHLKTIIRKTKLYKPLCYMASKFFVFKKKIKELPFSKDNLILIEKFSKNRSGGVSIASSEVTNYSDLPHIDITVVVYNNSQWIDDYINSLLLQKYPLDKISMIFVDNGSTDESLNKLYQISERYIDIFSKITVLKSINNGFGAGHDLAIKDSLSDLVLVSNLDLKFEKDAIINVIRSALADQVNSSDIACWELRQKPYEHPKFYDPVTLETPWCSHACVLLSRRAYNVAGGYDKNIFMYGEDVEFSYRLRSLGFKLRYIPSAVVYHYTYDEINIIKPLQFSGSLLSNYLIRLRYGHVKDKLIGLVLQILIIIRGANFKGSRSLAFGNVTKMIFLTPRFYQSRRKIVNESFPFYYFDYALNREGAFYNLCENTLGEGADKPLVSIITRTYKGRDYLLKQCAQSVYNQTYDNIEHIIVEDGGDTVKQTIKDIKSTLGESHLVKYIPLPKLGRSFAGNKGLENARGKYAVFLDDDDLLFSDHVEVLVNTLENCANIVAAYSLAWEVGTEFFEGGYIEKFYQMNSRFIQEYDKNKLYEENYIPIQSIMFKTNLFKESGGFDENVEYLEDWLLWIKYSLYGDFKLVKKTTSLFRTPSESTIRYERQKQLNNAYSMAIKKRREILDEFRSRIIK